MPTTEHDLEEPVEPFDDNEPLPVQRVIEQAEGRTVALTATLGFRDGPGFDSKSVVYGENPLPLFANGPTEVGYAAIFFDGEAVKADLFFTYSCPERLTIETKAYPLYAYPVAMTSPDTVRIIAILIDAGKPLDARIQAL